MTTPPPELTAEYLRHVVAQALDEDMGPDRCDLTTTAIVDHRRHGEAEVVAKAAGVVAGMGAFEEVCRQVDPGLVVTTRLGDGSSVVAGDVIAEIAGPLASLLKAERTALNFLQQLSGVATLTRRCVDAAPGVTVLDTRKTVPGLRPLQRLAVLAGGGVNHRYNLATGVLVKDNHVAAAGGVAAAVSAARSAGAPVEVEVTNEAELLEALSAGADAVLLDNMTPTQVAAAVSLVAGRVPVEVSGGVTEAAIAGYLAAGVDRISIGALTHSAPSLDISLELRKW